MRSSDLVSLMQEFYRDKLTLRERHVAGATRVSNYDFNNAYQYVINRDDTQVAWLREALAELGGSVPDAVETPVLPQGRRAEEVERAIIDEDARLAKAFVDRWQGRVETLSHARHRKMLQVVLGETVEQRRFFEQMLTGRDDVLGRRTGGVTTGGGVLPVRWLRP